MNELAWIKKLRKSPVSDSDLFNLIADLVEENDERYKTVATAELSCTRQFHMSNPYQAEVAATAFTDKPSPPMLPPAGWLPTFKLYSIWSWRFQGGEGSREEASEDGSSFTVYSYGDEASARQDLGRAVAEYLLES